MLKGTADRTVPVIHSSRSSRWSALMSWLKVRKRSFFFSRASLMAAFFSYLTLHTFSRSSSEGFFFCCAASYLGIIWGRRAGSV